MEVDVFTVTLFSNEGVALVCCGKAVDLLIHLNFKIYLWP